MTARPPVALWGVDGVIEPLAGGHRNQVFRIRTGARDLVIKSTRRSEAAIAWLVPVLSHATAAGFTVAAPMPSARGRFVENGWTCEPFLDGTPWTLALPKIAPMIAAFHRATARIPQRPGFAETRVLGTQALGGDIRLNDMPPDTVQVLRMAWRAFDDLPHSVVHGDLTPTNLIALPDGGIGLVDWDEARVDATAFDTSQTGKAPVDPDLQRALDAWECAACWQLEPDRARILATELRRNLVGRATNASR